VNRNDTTRKIFISVQAQHESKNILAQKSKTSSPQGTHHQHRILKKKLSKLSSQESLFAAALQSQKSQKS
jgi:hypothetical protein